MSVRHWLIHELKSLAGTAAFFGTFLGVLVVLKELVLEDYEVHFRGLSRAVVGTFIIAKVVLVMQAIPLGAWVRTRAAAVDVVLRTVLYGLGVLAALLLEKAFEARHEYGGFAAALGQIFHHRDMPLVWANVIVLACALLAFNALSVVRLGLGEGALLRLFLAPPGTVKGFVTPATPHGPAGGGDAVHDTGAAGAPWAQAG